MRTPNFLNSRVLVLLCAAFSALLFVGCGPKKGFVAREWSRNFREFNVEPIFPPREDVLVGDVYYAIDPLSGVDLDDYGYLPIKSHALYLDVRKDLMKFYQKRPRFAKTKLEDSERKRVWGQPTTDGGTWQYKDDNNPAAGMQDELADPRLAAFPSIKVDLAKDTTAIFPIEAMLFGFGSSEVKNVFLKVSGTETYQLDQWVLKKKLEAALAKGKLPISEKEYWVEVVSRVYMTREMDYSVYTKSNLNFQLQPAVAAGNGNGQGDGNGNGQGDGSGNASDNNSSAQELYWFQKSDSSSNPNSSTTAERRSITSDQVNQMMNNGSEANGSKFIFVSAQETSVGLKQIFERPLVIGVHTIKAKIKNGEVVEYLEGPTSSDAPVTKTVKSHVKMVESHTESEAKAKANKAKPRLKKKSN